DLRTPLLSRLDARSQQHRTKAVAMPVLVSIDASNLGRACSRDRDVGRQGATPHLSVAGGVAVFAKRQPHPLVGVLEIGTLPFLRERQREIRVHVLSPVR